MPKPRKRSPLERQVEQARRWLEEGRHREAADLVAPLAERHPDRLDLWTIRLAAATVLKHPIAGICRRLLRIAPEDDRPRLFLGLDHLDRRRFALALQDLRGTRNPLPPELQTALQEVEQRIPALQQEAGLPAGDEGFRLLALLDDSDELEEEGRFDLAEARLREVLAAAPASELALVRLGSTLWRHASLDEVEAQLDDALRAAPESGHLLLRKVRVLLARDRPEEARELAGRLAALDPHRPGLRIAQAFAWLETGEFTRVADLLEGAREDVLPLLHQAAGVAALRLGRPHAARRHWEQSGVPEAAQNLADLDQPPAERGGPWLHRPHVVLPRALCRDLESGEPHPVLPGALRALIGNAGPEGRRLAVAFALRCADPRVTAVLAEYALSDLGPDASRIASAMVCVQRGALPPGRTRMLIAGEWEDFQLVRCVPRTAPRVTGPAKAVRLVQRADELNTEGLHVEAEAAAREALALNPADPQLRVEVATCLFMQGRADEAEALLAGLPPLPSATILAALLDLARGRREAARERLDESGDFPELSGGELSAYAQARMELAGADRAEARSWALLGDWADPRAGLAALVPREPG